MKKATIFASVIGLAVGAGVVAKIKTDENNKLMNKSNKHLALFLMMNEWVKLKQEGKNFVSYFVAQGWKRIAIYGMSYAGKTLIDELKGSDIEIVCAMDRNADAVIADINVVPIEDACKNVDCVVVTAITFFDEIKKVLVDKFDCPIISLDEILWDVSENNV